jgi:phospholipid transport system substrate-binding protein
MYLTRQLLFVLASVLLLVTCAVGGSVDTPRQLVINVSNQVIRALNKDPQLEHRDSNAIYKLLNRIVVPHFDFDAIAQLVLGHYWRDADPQQRQRFIAEFRTHLVRFYAVSLAKYKNQKIAYKPVRADGAGKDVEVRTEAQQQGGPPLPIDYRLHLKDGDWKVYDLTVDGVSLVTSNRSSFAAEIQQGGIDALTTRLAQHNRENGG